MKHFVSSSDGGRFDFDDGGTYCGNWRDGKAHDFGICTGPKGNGEYSGIWGLGFELNGVYTWPNGMTYEGDWQLGRRHGLGVENRIKWIYRGEWTSGLKGRYGIRFSTSSSSKFEGTWSSGFQDGYGVETYADGGTYKGQWLRGMRHGYGVRNSVPYGLASSQKTAVLTSFIPSNDSDRLLDKRDSKLESRGGFVLVASSLPPTLSNLPQYSSSYKPKTMKDKSKAFGSNLLLTFNIRKRKSISDLTSQSQTYLYNPTKNTGKKKGKLMFSYSQESSVSAPVFSAENRITSDDALSFISQEDVLDMNITEMYAGEWKNDKRCGFGVCERSDGLRYEGEWFNNKKNGYGCTNLPDGRKEEGKYKNNILVSTFTTSSSSAQGFSVNTSRSIVNLISRSNNKLKEKVDNAVSHALRACHMATQKSDIAVSRSNTANEKAEKADLIAQKARENSNTARLVAKKFAPDFHQPGTVILKKRLRDQTIFMNTSFNPPLFSKSLNINPPALDSQSIASLYDSNLARELYPPNNLTRTRSMYTQKNTAEKQAVTSKLDVPMNHMSMKAPSISDMYQIPPSFPSEESSVPSNIEHQQHIPLGDDEKYKQAVDKIAKSLSDRSRIDKPFSTSKKRPGSAFSALQDESFDHFVHYSWSDLASRRRSLFQNMKHCFRTSEDPDLKNFPSVKELSTPHNASSKKLFRRNSLPSIVVDSYTPQGKSTSVILKHYTKSFQRNRNLPQVFVIPDGNILSSENELASRRRRLKSFKFKVSPSDSHKMLPDQLVFEAAQTRRRRGSLPPRNEKMEAIGWEREVISALSSRTRALKGIVTQNNTLMNALLSKSIFFLLSSLVRLSKDPYSAKFLRLKHTFFILVCIHMFQDI